MKYLKNIFLFMPRIILTLLNTIWFIICFAVTLICCPVVLIIWCFTYATLRNSGKGGMFHGLFFRGPFSLYRVCKNYRLIWEL